MVVIETATEADALTGGALAVLEAALESWAECGPDGYLLQESAVPPALELIASRIPGSRDSPRTTEMVVDMFLPTASEDDASIFQKMLRSRAGYIHLLHFWRAFGEASRLLSGLRVEDDSDAAEVAPRSGAERLAEEVETLRDTLLRELERHPAVLPSEQGYEAQSMPLSAFIALVRGAAEMSFAPDFWHSMEQGVCSGKPLDETSKLKWDDLTSVLISWLREAAAWKAPDLGEEGEDGEAAGQEAAPSAEKAPKEEGMPVLVHIYDVSREDNVHKLNKWLAHKRNPFKFGGVFHAGVEVNGLEWSFGMSLMDSVPGVACSVPKEHPDHRYRQTVKLRCTQLSAEEVADVISQLIEDYPGDDYDLLRRNCCHFADDFARRLGAGRLPGWVYRLARVGAMVDSALQRVANRSLLSEDTALV